MDYFCGSTFWDTNVTWNTDSPNFTPCFQKTVLVWIPCGYLWLAALIEVYQMIASKEANIPWNKLNVSKLIITLLLILLEVANFGNLIYTSSREQNLVYDADLYNPVIKMLTFTLSATILYYNRKYGLRTSGVLFVFWLLLILAGLPQLKTEIINYKTSGAISLPYSIGSYTVYYMLVIIMFIINCFADLPPRKTSYHSDKKESPEDTSGVPSRLTFSWFDPIAVMGYRRNLTKNDLYSLSPSLMSKEVVRQFEKHWKRALKRKASKSLEPDCSERSSLKGHKKEKKLISILPIMIKAFGLQFLIAIIMGFCNDLLLFAAPALLRALIGFLEGNEPVWRGYLYAVGLLTCASLQTAFSGQFYLKTTKVSVKINGALSNMLYKKALNLANEAKKTSTVGEIMNLMSTDLSRFNDLTLIHMLWSAPILVTLAIYFLWGVLGPSALAALVVVIVLMPCNAIIAGILEKYQEKVMICKDERIKLTTEILNGMKVIKIYAWEKSFQEQILKIRNKEIKLLKTMFYYWNLSSFVWFSTPFLVAVTSFGCFVLIHDTEVLDSKRAFEALALFNILRYPITMLPQVLSNAIQTHVSIKRLNNFMNCEELDPRIIEHNPNEHDQVVVEDGQFTWDDEESSLALNNINMRIPRGSLVAVVGAVGSGKSSLISALLGEMNKISGRVNVKGSTAYISQQAWIQNNTIQNNIIFGCSLIENKYEKILEACALKPDLAILPGGDQTEIGEKGINLSGGQKQRVSLARAVYFDADNYFLDDPLSAVDSHVGKHLFDQIIGPNGLLKNKTRVWVTHNVSYLAQTDFILVLKDGQIWEAGKYHELVAAKGALVNFLLQNLNEDDDAEVVKHDMESTLGLRFQDKIQRARSLSSGDTASQIYTAGENHVKPKEYENETEKCDFDQLIEVERTETGRVKWAIYKYYLVHFGIVAAVAMALAYITIHSLQISGNFWLVRWSTDTNMLLNGTVDTKLRDMYLGVYAGIGLAHVTLSVFTDLIPILAGLNAANVLHELLLKNLLRAPLQFTEVTPVGRIISRLSKDLDALDTSLAWQFATVINFMFEILGTLFVISYSTPIFIGVIIPIAVLYYAIQRFYVPTSRQLMRIMSVARSPTFSHFNESVLGATTIRAFGVKERFVKESQQKVDNYLSSFYLRSIADRWLGIRLQIVGSLIIFFTALLAVINRDNINAGLAGLAICYTLQITEIMSYTVQATSLVESDMVAVERMNEYAEIQSEAEWNKETDPQSSWPESGRVEFEKLTLAYRNGKDPALRDITCSVAPGDKVGIVGRTGAGKSTLTLALFRIIEATSGRILIDGLDISKIGLHHLRSRIGIIPQDPVLFSGTLRTNLDPFKMYSDDDIYCALEHAHLKPFVLGLRAGLQHDVLEGGENLSVGQRQLICLARALLRKTKVLVLDEATAAIDLETDELIQKTIRSEFKACTVITIAHRLKTILDSTKVMVLDKGQIAEFATPEELLRDKSSRFYSLAKADGLVS